ncbi:hypothetical protein BZL30_3553 [Mycobacterium kansasii]|uniref:Uncharacterized protein n=1 Tax=Mycobacterium kansasii TaxID=1768 RepID=A0A1V3X8D3_MYCKA|nr:hypothetical protein BZL30_3553 [Mycobacterium kansasii]
MAPVALRVDRQWRRGGAGGPGAAGGAGGAGAGCSATAVPVVTVGGRCCRR